MPFEIDYTILPQHMRDGARLYVEEGLILESSFLRMVFENDLVHSFCKADDINLSYMRSWVEFLYACCPVQCWGSKEKVDYWVAQRGLNGLLGSAENSGSGDSEEERVDRDLADNE